MAQTPNPNLMKVFVLSLLCSLLQLSGFTQRKVALSVKPTDAIIYVKKADGQQAQIGTGNAEVEVEKNTTTTIIIKREGFRPYEKTYRYLNGEKPPKEDAIELKEKQVTLNIMPYDARVYLDGRGRRDARSFHRTVHRQENRARKDGRL